MLIQKTLSKPKRWRRRAPLHIFLCWRGSQKESQSVSGRSPSARGRHRGPPCSSARWKDAGSVYLRSASLYLNTSAPCWGRKSKGFNLICTNNRQLQAAVVARYSPWEALSKSNNSRTNNSGGNTSPRRGWFRKSLLSVQPLPKCESRRSTKTPKTS